MRSTAAGCAPGRYRDPFRPPASVSEFFPSPARRSCAATDLRIPGGGDERTPISGDRGDASSTKEAAMNKAPTHTAHPAFDAVGDVWELDLSQARDRLIAARAHQ